MNIDIKNSSVISNEWIDNEIKICKDELFKNPKSVFYSQRLAVFNYVKQQLISLEKAVEIERIKGKIEVLKAPINGVGNNIRYDIESTIYELETELNKLEI